MLAPIHEELWVNPSDITKLVQKGKDVEIYFRNGDVTLVTGAIVEDVGKYLNTLPY